MSTLVYTVHYFCYVSKCVIYIDLLWATDVDPYYVLVVRRLCQLGEYVRVGVRLVLRVYVRVFRGGVICIDSRVSSQYVRGLRLILRTSLFRLYTNYEVGLYTLATMLRVGLIGVFRRVGNQLLTSVLMRNATGVVYSVVFSI